MFFQTNEVAAGISWGGRSGAVAAGYRRRPGGPGRPVGSEFGSTRSEPEAYEPQWAILLSESQPYRNSDFANEYPHGIELADDRGVGGREQPERSLQMPRGGFFRLTDQFCDVAAVAKGIVGLERCADAPSQTEEREENR